MNKGRGTYDVRRELPQKVEKEEKAEIKKLQKTQKLNKLKYYQLFMNITWKKIHFSDSNLINLFQDLKLQVRE